MHRDASKSRFAIHAVLAASTAGVLMQSVDTTITNVALPYMQGGISASREQITWVLTSYTMAAAIMSAPVGWIAARYGRKEFLLFSLLAFTFTSMLCGISQSLDQMVLFRCLQGAVGAALPPLCLAILLDLYPADERPKIIAIWSMGAMLGPVLGPTLGGFLTDAYDWRWVFYVNVPFGVLAAAIIAIFYKDTARDSGLRFDHFGFVTLSVALASLFLLLSRGTDKDWFDSGEIVIESLVAVVGFYLFFVHMGTAKNIVFSPKIFRDRNFSSGAFLAFFVNILLLGTVALLPPYLQTLGGYPILDVGLLMVPRGICMMLGMLIIGRWGSRIDPRLVMTIAILMVTWSMWQMTTWSALTDAWSMGSVTAIQGLGLGFLFVPLNLLTFSTLPTALRTDGAAVANLIGRVGGSIGILITTVVFANSSQAAQARLTAHATPFNRMLLISTPQSLASFESQISLRASNIAYGNNFLLMFYVSASALAFVWLMKKR
jgi:DHA2 family multidrug resistance protein